MARIVREECRKQCYSISCRPQFWGRVSSSRHTEDMKAILREELRGDSDKECAVGNNWYLVSARGTANDIASSSCDGRKLHVATVGMFWPLGDDARKGAHLVAGLYRTHGDAVINHCDGQFAAVIIDPTKDRTVLTINWPGGFHDLYYCMVGHTLSFATHLDLLIHRCGWRAQPNEQALVELLRFGGLAGEDCLIQGVRRVLPGTAVVFEKGNIVQKSIYEYPAYEGHEPSGTDELRSLHKSALQKVTSGNADFGLFLSGGLDSSLNVAAAAELSGKPVKTFAAVFDDPDFDESSDARLVAEKYDTEHHEIHIDTATGLDRLPEMVWAMQSPMADSSYIPSFYVAEATKKYVDVAIAGDGPDHFLGRYYSYAAWFDLWRRFPGGLKLANWCVGCSGKKTTARHYFWGHARRRRSGRALWHAMACAATPCGAGLLNFSGDYLWGSLPPNDIVRLLSPDLLQRTTLASDNHRWLARWNRNNVRNIQSEFILADVSLDGLCGVFSKAGTMCAVHNLAVHEPYLSRSIMHYLYAMKNSLKVGGTWRQHLTRTVPNSETKRILRRAAAGRLSSRTVEKQKRGFCFPLAQSWRQATHGVDSRRVFSAILDRTDWFNPAYVDRLLREQSSGARDHRHVLLLLAALDQWFRIFITGDAVRPSWTWSDCF